MATSLLVGCSYSPVIGDVDVATSSTTTEATGGSVDSSTGSASSTSGSSTAAAPDDGDLPDPAGFIMPTDFPPGAFECDQFAQDCPQGDKCVYWAYDGGPAYNGLRCVPVVDDPRGFGEVCTVEPPENSGVDDCVLGAQCWNGACVPICQGSANDPACPDGYGCSAASGNGPLFCRAYCNPLELACPGELTCGVANSGEFWCGPTFYDDAVAGQSCDWVNACGPAKVCIDAEQWPGCEGSGCCAPFCDHTQPDADAGCDASGAGTVCVAWFEPGQAIPTLEHVGVCRVP